MICPSCGSENIEGSDRCENCLASFRDLDVPSADSAEGYSRHVMEDKLSGLEKETPLIVAPDTPAIEVARQMKELNTGCALVLDGPNLLGIFTEHDVLLKMCSNLMSDRANQTAVDSRNGGHEEAAIVADDIPIPDAPGDIPLEEIRAEEMLVEEPLVAVEVEGGVAHQDSSILQVPVKELMTTNPETLHEHESVAFALNKMSMGRFRHIPVKKDDGAYTVVSIKSVFKYIAQEDW